MNDIELARSFLAKKESSDSRKIPFELSFKKYKQLMIRKTCFYSGVKFEEKSDKSRSLERLDSNKGYTDKNTIACTKRINNLKNNLTIGELNKLVNKLNKIK